MKVAPIPANEKERLSALYGYDLLDSLPEQEYDDITRIAADICGMPISAISLIDTDRQWFKSRVGLDDNETDRDLAFCAHAILKPEDIFVIDNPSADERFHDNPLVTGKPNIAFYAGVPLVNETGSALGTLCVMDSKPRSLTAAQTETLKALARQTVAYFEIRRKNKELAGQQAQIEMMNKDLSQFAYVAAHDIKSPCSSIAMSISYLKDKYSGMMDDDGRNLLDMMEETSMAAIHMVDGILAHTRMVNTTDITKEKFTFGDLADELKKIITLPSDFSFGVGNPSLELFAPRQMILQALQNLCNNAIKYNDKTQAFINISASENGVRYIFNVSDNGRGISEADQARIFEMFSTLNVTDRFNNKGTGIGLSTVQRLVEKMGGDITVHSVPGMGSNFEFTVDK